MDWIGGKLWTPGLDWIDCVYADDGLHWVGKNAMSNSQILCMSSRAYPKHADPNGFVQLWQGRIKAISAGQVRTAKMRAGPLQICSLAS